MQTYEILVALLAILVTVSLSIAGLVLVAIAVTEWIETRRARKGRLQ